MGAAKVVKTVTLGITVRTVPKTVPGVVSKVTPEGLLESIFSSVSTPVRGAMPSVIWRLILKGAAVLTYLPFRTASCRPRLKAIGGAIVPAVRRPI